MNMGPLRNKIQTHFADFMIEGDIKLEVITIGFWDNELEKDKMIIKV